MENVAHMGISTVRVQSITIPTALQWLVELSGSYGILALSMCAVWPSQEALYMMKENKRGNDAKTNKATIVRHAVVIVQHQTLIIGLLTK
jgi:hypothetical protein